MTIRFLPLIALCGCTVFIDNSDNYFLEQQSNIIYSAEEYLNMHEKRNRAELKSFLGVDPYRVEWCAAFVNSVLEQNGLEGTKSLLARSFLDWGVKVYSPEQGDVVILRRGNYSWQGHVGFYAGKITLEGVEYYVLLGGNQEDQVTYDLFRKSRVIGIRRPTEWS